MCSPIAACLLLGNLLNLAASEWSKGHCEARDIDATKLMKRPIQLFALLLAFAAAGHAAPVPPPEKLLPADTVAMFTIPDNAKAGAARKESPLSLLLSDAAVKPFTDKFMNKLRADVIAPLEKSLGIKFADYTGLAQGQFTIALLANAWDTAAPKEPGVLVLMDAREQSGSLKTNLATLKAKWVEGGNQLRTEKIRNVEFTVLIVKDEELKQGLGKVFPKSKAADAALEPPKPGDAADKPTEIFVGQSDSLLVVGTASREVEKILASQAGSGTGALLEQATFSKSFGPMFRDAQSYGWMNTKAIIDAALKAKAKDDEGGQGGGAMGMKPDKLLGALGIMGLQSAAFSVRDTGDGYTVHFNLNVPEGQRKGLFKLLAFETRDANPPPFVPADALKFSRVRIDLPKAWATLEAAVTEAVPQAATFIKMMVENAGKDKDPNFDLRKNLIANLGDDVISYQKAPRQQTLAGLNDPPSLILIGSPRAEQAASAIKALSAVMPQPKVKEREFLGRTVYALGLPPAPAPGGGRPVERALHYAASGGYVAMSTDVAMLEEFLRNGDSAPKALRDTPGLSAAAQKIGGMSTGMFGYENQLESMRISIETLKKESGTLANLLGASPFSEQMGLGENAEKLKDWVDFGLLPSFDKISRYFHFTVATGSIDNENMGVKLYVPRPPQLKK